MTEAPAPAPDPAPAPVAAAPAAPAAPAVAPVLSGDTSRRGVVSPVVRKLASESGVDLAMVPGSGEGGRITRKDVETFISSGAPAPAAEPQAAPATPAVAPPPPMAAGAGRDVQEIPRLRQRIATNLRAAKDTAAHVWTSVEVDFENVERRAAEHRAAFKAAEGTRSPTFRSSPEPRWTRCTRIPVVNSQFDLDGNSWTFNGSSILGLPLT